MGACSWHCGTVAWDTIASCTGNSTRKKSFVDVSRPWSLPATQRSKYTATEVLKVKTYTKETSKHTSNVPTGLWTGSLPPQPPQPFYGPFSGTTRFSRCQKRTLDFTVQGKINRGRHRISSANQNAYTLVYVLMSFLSLPVTCMYCTENAECISTWTVGLIVSNTTDHREIQTR